MSPRWPSAVPALAALFILMIGAVSTAAGSDAAEADAASAGPGAALEALLAHIPESHRDACRPDLVDEEDESVLMSVHCELTAGLTVSYTQLDSPEALAERYQRRLELESIMADTGDCSEAVPGDEAYTIGGEPAGRLLCYEALGYDTFHWTHDASRIYGQAFQEGDLPGLWAWWAGESGPVEPAAPSQETGLGAALDALLLQVPAGHREGCLPFYGGKPENGVVVSLKCAASPDLDVYYSRFDSAEAVAASYQRELESAGIAEDAGACSSALPGEEPYTIGGQPAGRLLCDSFFDSIQFTWTHEPTLIEGTAFSDADLADVWDWWLRESGPIG